MFVLPEVAGSAKHLIERHVGTWRCSLSGGTFEDEHAWEGETKKVCSPCVGLRGRMYLKLHGSVAAKSLGFLQGPEEATWVVDVGHRCRRR